MKRAIKIMLNVILIILWIALGVSFMAAVVIALTSCTSPAPVVYYDQYQTGGLYTIEDTTINKIEYLIGTK